MAVPQRYFALFGPKASGKTAYLGALYGSCAEANGDGLTYHVGASEDADDPTHAYLGKVFRALRSGAWPDSTGFERLEKLAFRFTSAELVREVVLPDVAGELTQRAADATARAQLAVELKAKILAEYADYQGFLLVVPADSVDASRASEYKWEVDALLNALRERTPEGRTIARPFAVLVTKWDLIEPGPVTEDSERRAVAYLEATHPELASGLKVLCRNYRVFPVSATGACVGGLPPVPLRPANLGAPIAWLIETADRVQLEHALAYIEDHKGILFRRDSKDDTGRMSMDVASARLAAFLEDVPHGPLADEARAAIQRLRARARARRTQRMIAVGVALVVMTAFGLGCRDQVAYAQASALLNNASPRLSSREVIERTGAIAREPWWKRPVGYKLFGGPRLRREFADYCANYERRCFEELQRRSPPTDEKDAEDLLEKVAEFQREFPASDRSSEVAHMKEIAERVAGIIKEDRESTSISQAYKTLQQHSDDAKLAGELLARCDQFLKAFPASQHGTEVNRIKTEVQATIRTQERKRNYAALMANLDKAAGAPMRCYELCGEFLNDDSHPQADEVRRRQAGFLRHADDQAWGLLALHAQKYPNNFLDSIEKANAYLANSLFNAHRGEVIKAKADAAKGHDRAAYEAICEDARAGNHPATLRKVAKLCRDYVKAPTPGKNMATEVEQWLKWYDGWDAGKELRVKVTMVRINRDSIWYHGWSYHDPWVYAVVTVGPKRYRTEYKSIPLEREVHDLPGAPLGPFTWKWGDPVIAVALHHKGASPEDLTNTFDAEDEFKVRHLDGVTTFDGGKIVVRLECPDVIPPVLPAYK